MKIIFSITASIILLTSCGKSNTSNKEVIDVASQQYIDYNGNLLGATADGGYFGNNLTSREMALFNSLDTANLAGTIKPSGILSSGIYPNPSFANGFFNVQFRLDNNFTGSLIAKYIIVDSLLNPVSKIVGNLNFSGQYSIHTIAPSTPVGRFRLYYSLSANGYNNFYYAWVNITRIN